MRFELSERAAQDIRAIIRYTLEHFGRAQMDDYVGGLYASFELLGDNPLIGRVVPETAIRFYTFRMHYVFYEVRPDVIRVAHIRHTSMQFPSPQETPHL